MSSVVLLLGNRVKRRLDLPYGFLLLPDRRHLKRVKFTTLLQLTVILTALTQEHLDVVIVLSELTSPLFCLPLTVLPLQFNTLLPRLKVLSSLLTLHIFYQLILDGLFLQLLFGFLFRGALGQEIAFEGGVVQLTDGTLGYGPIKVGCGVDQVLISTFPLIVILDSLFHRIQLEWLNSIVLLPVKWEYLASFIQKLIKVLQSKVIILFICIRFRYFFFFINLHWLFAH